MTAIITYLIIAVSIITVTTVFEFTKALTSHLLGDPTPKKNGRLTLNPLKHFEPIGFMLFLFSGYGWGKPVETSSLGYKNRKTAVTLTYGMPIVVSFVLGVLFCLVARFVPITAFFMQLLGTYFIKIAVFNCIPVEPLCASRILKNYMDPNAALSYRQTEKIILWVMVFLLLSVGGILSSILDSVTLAVVGAIV